MLFCVITLLIGWQLTIFGISIGSFIALIIEKLKRNNKHLPFGPYLVVGFIISLLIGDFIFNFIYL